MQIEIATTKNQNSRESIADSSLIAKDYILPLILGIIVIIDYYIKSIKAVG